MIDYVGQPIELGARVVHGKSGRYGGFSGPYYVIGFSPAMVRLSRQVGGAEYRKSHPLNLVVVP